MNGLKPVQRNVRRGLMSQARVIRNISVKSRQRYISSCTIRPPKWALTATTRALNLQFGQNGQTRPRGKLYSVVILGGWWYHLPISRSGTSGIRLWRQLRLSYQANAMKQPRENGSLTSAFPHWLVRL